MTNFTHKFPKLVLGATIQVVAVALFLVVFGVSAVFAVGPRLDRPSVIA